MIAIVLLMIGYKLTHDRRRNNLQANEINQLKYQLGQAIEMIQESNQNAVYLKSQIQSLTNQIKIYEHRGN